LWGAAGRASLVDMGIVPRVLLAVVILVVDFVSFLVPLGSIVLAWVILARPRWARDFVARLYGEDGPAGPSGPEAQVVEGPPGEVGGAVEPLKG
jgi:hypothetical protein